MAPKTDLLSSILSLFKRKGTSTSSRQEAIPDFIVINGEKYSTSLTELRLTYMGLSNNDIKSLRYMTKLKFLNLRNNRITDISPLSALTNLTELWLDENPITDIRPLSTLTSLLKLHFYTNN